MRATSAGSMALPARRPMWPVGVPFAAGELLLLRDAWLDDALTHWAIGASVAMVTVGLLALGWLALKGAPVRALPFWAMGVHLYGTLPDLSPGPTAGHAGWTDVFLVHASLGRVGLSLTAWLSFVLVVFSALGWVLWRWRRAPSLEVEAGMVPGIGLGGDALPATPTPARSEHPRAHERRDRAATGAAAARTGRVTAGVGAGLRRPAPPRGGERPP